MYPQGIGQLTAPQQMPQEAMQPMQAMPQQPVQQPGPMPFMQQQIPESLQGIGLNLVQTQDKLKDLADGQLMQYLQTGDGAPPALVLSELNRRNRVRNASAEQPQTTVADDILMQSMQGGLGQMAPQRAQFADGGSAGGMHGIGFGGDIESIKRTIRELDTRIQNGQIPGEHMSAAIQMRNQLERQLLSMQPHPIYGDVDIPGFLQDSIPSYGQAGEQGVGEYTGVDGTGEFIRPPAPPREPRAPHPIYGGVDIPGFLRGALPTQGQAVEQGTDVDVMTSAAPMAQPPAESSGWGGRFGAFAESSGLGGVRDFVAGRLQAMPEELPSSAEGIRRVRDAETVAQGAGAALTVPYRYMQDLWQGAGKYGPTIGELGAEFSSGVTGKPLQHEPVGLFERRPEPTPQEPQDAAPQEPAAPPVDQAAAQPQQRPSGIAQAVSQDPQEQAAVEGGVQELARAQQRGINVPLLTMGLSLMSTRRPDFIGALGESGLAGLQVYVSEQARDHEREQASKMMTLKEREVGAKEMSARASMHAAQARGASGDALKYPSHQMRSDLNKHLDQRMQDLAIDPAEFRMWADARLGGAGEKELAEAFFTTPGRFGRLSESSPNAEKRNRFQSLFSDYATLNQLDLLLAEGRLGQPVGSPSWRVDPNTAAQDPGNTSQLRLVGEARN